MIYLDHAATTPLDPRVKKAMEPFWSNEYGNPSALYKLGRTANTALQKSRKTVAEILSAKATEIVFTAGGTESVNLAILGMAQGFQHHFHKPSHIIISEIEHHSVLHAVAAMASWGWKVTKLAVDKDGFISLRELEKAIQSDTAMVSVMYANNEIGTIEPIAKIGKLLQRLNTQRVAKKLPRIYFHTDACQATGFLDLNVNRLGVDLLSANGSKIYGPKQTGFLYVRSGVVIEPLLHGGGQERDLRSGTENVPGIVGLATALQISVKEQDRENQRLIKLRDQFISDVLKTFPEAKLNGPDDRQLKKMAPPRRLPNNINFTFPGIEGEALMLYLDAKGIAVATGSACATTSTDPSHVIVALGRSQADAYNSVRFTLGRQTTAQDLKQVIKALLEAIKLIQKANK
jgi:cysteine desulfurase